MKEHNLVLLLEDLDKEGLKKGDIGTIVSVYSSMVYAVEFIIAENSVVVTLRDSQIKLIT